MAKKQIRWYDPINGQLIHRGTIRNCLLATGYDFIRDTPGKEKIRSEYLVVGTLTDEEKITILYDNTNLNINQIRSANRLYVALKRNKIKAKHSPSRKKIRKHLEDSINELNRLVVEMSLNIA